MAMLVVKETPVNDHQSIQDGDATVEGQLGDLSGLKFAICISKFDHGCVIILAGAVGNDAVVSSLLDGIVERARVVQVDGL
jgi:hypothetical protein